MTRITLQQFDGMTLEERDAYLERRDQAEREIALRRDVAQPDELFIGYALKLLSINRRLIFDLRRLSELVAHEASIDGITKPGSAAPYAPKTIYNHVNPRRLELLERLCGNGSR